MTYEIAPNRFYEAAGHSVMNPYKIELDLPNDLPANDICFTITNILRQDAAYGRRTIFYFYTYIDYVGSFNLVSRSYQKQWSGDHYVDTLVGTNTVQINANGITGIYSGTVVSDVTDGVFNDVVGTAAVLDAQGATDGGLAVATDYFNTPQSGSGTATVEINIEGENLTFESQMLGNTITRFIDGDAEVDMEDE